MRRRRSPRRDRPSGLSGPLVNTQEIIRKLEAIKMEVGRLRPAIADLEGPLQSEDLMSEEGHDRLRELVKEQRRLMAMLSGKRD